MRIRIDVSVFSSPTDAFGNASGEIEVAEVPKDHQTFPWPSGWVAERPAYFTPEQSLIWSVTEMNGQPSVLLSGIVCNSVAEARDCSAFLEERSGLFFNEYDYHAPSREA